MARIFYTNTQLEVLVGHFILHSVYGIRVDRTQTEVCLTLILPTWRIWWASNNASKWQMGCNSAFKALSFPHRIKGWAVLL